MPTTDPEMPPVKPDPRHRLVDQVSCLDCFYKHRPSQCRMRQGRIVRLRAEIERRKVVLAGLLDYDYAVRSGWPEPPSSYERWDATQRAGAHNGDPTEAAAGTHNDSVVTP